MTHKDIFDDVFPQNKQIGGDHYKDMAIQPFEFISKNELDIKNYIEFAKIFQVSSKKIKNIKKIYFDLQKNIGMSDVVITNVKINNLEGTKISEELFFVKNIQNLRSHIRKIID